MENIMSAQSYVIEIADEAAGIVVQERGGFRFYAASSSCASLNQRVFNNVRGAERACRTLMEFHAPRANSMERVVRGNVGTIAARGIQ
jgi:hypothetical protein